MIVKTSVETTAPITDAPLQVHSVLSAMRDTVLPNLHRGSRLAVTPEPGENTDAFAYGMHAHAYYEWVWLLENSMHLNIAGTVYELLPGDFCLLPPRTLHAEVVPTDTQPYTALWCYYSDDAVFCRLHHNKPLGQIFSETFHGVQAPADINILLAGLDNELNGGGAYSAEVRQALVSSFAYLLTRAFEAGFAQAEDGDLPGSLERRVRGYVDGHYAENVTLASISRALRMSRNNLCALYKSESGRTVGETLTAVRLNAAKRLLAEERVVIHEVAKATGFQSATTFCRAFQRHEGMPPSQYARMMQKDNSEASQ